MPARYVIHTAGPVYRNGKHGEALELRLCYQNSLTLAVENQCSSVAFPLISSGIYGYPKAEALQVASASIRDFLKGNKIDAYLTVFDKEAFRVSKRLLDAVQSYIDERYVDAEECAEYSLLPGPRQVAMESKRVHGRAGV